MRENLVTQYEDPPPSDDTVWRINLENCEAGLRQIRKLDFCTPR